MVREAGGELDDLLASGDLAERVGDDLAVLGGDDLGELALLRLEQLAEPEQDLLALGEREVAPGGERRLGRRDGRRDLGVIGQGDVLVTPIQMASIYAAIANGGTLYQPTVGKAIVSPDGQHVEEIEPQVNGRIPADDGTLANLQAATESVITTGSASWRFAGWPQDEIPLHAKTGTAEGYGDQQTDSWLATFSEDYTVVMTISQAGTGSGASGPAVRNIYEALYGVGEDGSINEDAALLPE